MHSGEAVRGASSFPKGLAFLRKFLALTAFPNNKHARQANNISGANDTTRNLLARCAEIGSGHETENCNDEAEDLSTFFALHLAMYDRVFKIVAMRCLQPSARFSRRRFALLRCI